MLDDVVLLELGTLDALATALLRAVQVGARALGVAGLGDGDHHVLAGDEVLVGHVAVGRDDAGTAVIAVHALYLEQLFFDDPEDQRLIGQQTFEISDALHKIARLLADSQLRSSQSRQERLKSDSL